MKYIISLVFLLLIACGAASLEQNQQVISPNTNNNSIEDIEDVVIPTVGLLPQEDEHEQNERKNELISPNTFPNSFIGSLPMQGFLPCVE